jgi:hypothetical protein
MEGNAQKQLISKVQYKNYEPGEFTEREERSYEETIRLIEEFPWSQFSDHLQVGLTNPSITIEGEAHHFVKLTLYYNGSFVLYYLDDAHHLYQKSFPGYELAYPYIKSFFADSLLDTAGMELQQFWIQGKSAHFDDRDFRYTLTWPKIIFYSSLSGGYLVILCAMMLATLVGGIAVHKAFFIVSLVLVFMVLLMTLTLAQLINHFRAVIGKELILSKGKDIFYFGKTGQPEEWDKKNIVSIVDFSPSAQRSSKYGRFVRIDIRSADSATARTVPIYIPSVLISEIDLLAKFPSIKSTHISKFFPFTPLSASAPS